MMKRALFLMFIPLILLAPVASAQEELVTDRPDQTESAAVVPVGSVQIETGVLYVNDYYRWTFSLPTALVRVGVTDDLELRFTGEYVHDKYQLANIDYVDQGIAGISAGAKIEIIEENGFIPSAAFIGHIALPVGSPAFRPTHVAPDFRFAFSHSLGDGFTISSNLGGEWDGDGGSGAGIYTLALGFDLWEDWGGYIEAFGSMWGDSRPSHLLDGGVTILAAPNFQFDASFALPFTERGPDYYANVGLSWRLPE
jgi:Putative MetA-pathway of phenol degradation